jgi:hypothetical protein
VNHAVTIKPGSSDRRQAAAAAPGNQQYVSSRMQGVASLLFDHSVPRMIAALPRVFMWLQQ